MTAARLEDLLDETTLQDLDFDPPCSLDGIHAERQVPIQPADLVVLVQAPCRCAEPRTVLICSGCDDYLAGVIASCIGCHALCTWQQSVLDRRPL